MVNFSNKPFLNVEREYYADDVCKKSDENSKALGLKIKYPKPILTKLKEAIAEPKSARVK